MNQQIPFRVLVRTRLKELLPTSLFGAVSALWQKTGARFYDVQGIVERYTKQFLATHPKVVQGGPFAGLKYVDKAVGSNYLHKLIGSYEAILHPVMREIAQKDFKTIIDIGSAEGYYLAGLGRLLPDATLVGFEIEESGRQLTEELLVLNEIHNQSKLYGEATAHNVAPVVTEKTLVICDCEGAELDILNPALEPSLATVDMYVIELHDFIRPGIKEALLERFSTTHVPEVIKFKMANPEEFPFLAGIENKQDCYELCRERGWQEQEWLILRMK